MKRRFTATPSSAISSATAQSGLTVHGVKSLDLAQQIWDGEFNEIADDRLQELNWSEYSTVEELADDIPMLLWVVFGLQDGEDYQIMNGFSILPVDSTKEIWTRVQEELC